MFTVKYGNDQQKLFNSNCQTINLLNHIASSCGYKGDIDLAEETTCLLQFLRDIPQDYANCVLKARTSYILVEVKKNEDNTISYNPLWDTSNSKQPFIVKAQKQLITRGRPKSPTNPTNPAAASRKKKAAQQPAPTSNSPASTAPANAVPNTTSTASNAANQSPTHPRTKTKATA